MLPFTSHHDPGDEQLELPVPVAVVCRCGAKDASQCSYWTLWTDVPRLGRRPFECLRRHDPSKAQIPF